MAQYPTVIPDSNGTTFLANLNNSELSLVSSNSGASAPSSPTAGMLWYNTSLDALYVRNAANTVWDTILNGSEIGANVVHTIRNSAKWLFNVDGASTGAFKLQIDGLYSQTLSGGMNIQITQNNSTDGTYTDIQLYVAGNWRSSDHTWHNTKAYIKGATLPINLNVRFTTDGTNAHIVIGDTSSTWTYPRLAITDILSNAIVSGYSPDFTITNITTYPSSVQSTIATTFQNIGSAPTKTSLVSADKIGLWDSVTSALSAITWSNFLTYFTTTFAPLVSPALTGTPTAPTATAGDNSTKISTTAFVASALSLGGKVPNNSQTFTSSGTFTVPTGVTSIMIVGSHAGAGAGGAGGGSTSGGDGGGGAASVFSAPKILSVTPSQTIVITLGAGGAGGAGGVGTSGVGGAGGFGGNTNIGTFALNFFGSIASGAGGAAGGAGGGGGGTAGGAAGSGGTAGGAAGSAGTGGVYPFYTQATGGLAASGGAGTGGTSDCVNGSGGSLNSGTTGGAGGAGGAGQVIMYW